MTRKKGNTRNRRSRRKQRLTVDHGPEERQQHGIHEEIETMVAGVTALRNVTVDPISTYVARKAITDLQFQAGDTFAGQYRTASLAAVYQSVRMDATGGSGMTDEAAERIQQAKEVVRAALMAVGYPLAGIIVHVCGDGENAGSWGGVRGSSRRTQDGMVALRLALDGLVKHYRFGPKRP